MLILSHFQKKNHDCFFFIRCRNSNYNVRRNGLRLCPQTKIVRGEMLFPGETTQSYKVQADASEDEEIIINSEHALRDWKNRSFKTPSTGTKHRSVNENADTCAEHFTRYCCHTRRETFSEPSRGNNKRQQQKTPNPAELRFFFSSFFLKKIIKQFCVK